MERSPRAPEPIFDCLARNRPVSAPDELQIHMSSIQTKFVL
jgi:hypothetical protein